MPKTIKRWELKKLEDHVKRAGPEGQKKRDAMRKHKGAKVSNETQHIMLKDATNYDRTLSKAMKKGLSKKKKKK